MSWPYDEHIGPKGLPRLVALILLLCGSLTVCAQTYVLDQGVKPVPIRYQDDPGGEYRQVGVLKYKAELLNGAPVDNANYVFGFADEEEARLAVTVTVDVTRPNSRKHKDLRVIFPREAFGAMGRSGWQVDTREGSPYNTVLAHGQSKRFVFRYRKDGVVDFNLPFVVTTRSTPSDEWRLPPAGSLRNHLLSRQIKVTGLLSEEDRLWRRGKGNFAGVATYLRAYPRGKYEREAGRLFTNWLEEDFQRLVVNSESLDEVRSFINQYTPYEDFEPVAERLEAARARLRGSNATINTTSSADKPVRRRARSRRPATVPVPSEDVSAGEPAARIISEDNGVQTIKLYNFKQPAYYDIYGGLLDIDDSKMRSESLIRIRQIKQGTVDFLVVEREDESRYATVQLHNLMQVGLTFDEVLGQYEMTIDGGNKPYQLYLQPLDGQRYDWGMDEIETNQVSIPVYDLQRAGLEGNYIAQVTSAGARKPLTLSSVVIAVPEPLGNYTWVYPLLVAIGIGLLALGLLFVLNRIGRRRKYLRDRQRIRV